MVQEVLNEELCKKFVHDESLPVEGSVSLAEDMFSKKDEKHDVLFNNCEHTAGS